MQIYRIYHIESGKSYIGATKWSFDKRYPSNNWLKYTHSSYLKNSADFYGRKNFEWEILWEGNCDEEELSNLEILYIEQYNSTYPNGYNLTSGGLCPSFWNFKEYELIDCFGNIYIIKNLRNFCEEKGLNYSAMCNMVSGRHPVSQGYALSNYDDKIPNPEKIIKFENTKTGAIEFVLNKNTSKWAKINKLNCKAVRSLVRGKIIVHRNWKLLETDISDYRGNEPKHKVLVKDKNGKTIKIENVYEFCKKNNLGRSSFYKLIKKQALECKGYTLAEHSEEDLENLKKSKLGKGAILISPEGKEVEVKNISDFARKNNLNKNGLYSIINQSTKTHKGWKAKK